MKILILGSEGFVGNNLVDGLSKNHQIVCGDVLESSNHDNYHQINIKDLQSVNKITQNVDVVVDLVAHSLTSSLNGSIENAEINIIGLLNVLESCRTNNVKKIIFSSASSLIGEPESYHVSENHIPTPKTAYGITKLASEHYLRLYFELYGINYTVFRFFNIYGPYQKNGLIPTLYKKIVENKPITVFGKGDQVRDYVFIEDIIPFFDIVSSTKTGENSVFNMGTGQGTTILEIINMMSNYLNVKSDIEFNPPRPGEIGNFVSDTTNLKKIFNQIPNTPVQQGLAKTIDWLKQH